MRNTLLMALGCLILAPASGPAAPEGGLVTGRVLLVRGKDTLSDAKDVWVYLKPLKKKTKQKFAKQNQSIEQKGRKFIPRVRVVSLGNAVGFPNRDTEPHNVFSPTEPGFDLGKFEGGANKDQPFLDAGEYDIFCDIHSEMSATVKVVESEWIAEVRKDTFSLRVPAGVYQLVAWTPNSDEVLETITVRDGGTVSAPTLHLQAPKFTGTKPHKRANGTDYRDVYRPRN